jgi:N-acetylornithine carbamoyltransferase
VGRPDLLALEEWSDVDVDRLLSLAIRAKRGELTGGLEGKLLALVMADRDSRAEAIAATAMFMHGGHATVLDLTKDGETLEGGAGVRMDGSAREHAKDLARSLGRWADGIAIRALPRERDWSLAREDSLVKCFADELDKPVLNLGSMRRNPVQALADAMTLRERLGDPQGKRFVLTWSWDPDPLPPAIPTSAALAAARLGMEIVISRPEGFELDPQDTALIRKIAQHAGGEFVHISEDPDDGVVGADVVYVASWGSVKLYGRAEEEQARSQFRDWGLTRSRHRGTRGGKGVVMHAPPVRRNVAIDDQILDGVDSAVDDQQENLLHAHRAVLLELIGKRMG